MSTDTRLRLTEIESRVCDVVAEQLGFPRNEVSPTSRLIEDLHCDSLELVELIMEIEQTFCVTLPDDCPIPVYKAVFTRSPFRLADLAELIYLQQGTGVPDRKRWRTKPVVPPPASSVPFSQLGGLWPRNEEGRGALLESLPRNTPVAQYRRHADGMRCMLIPAAQVGIGSDSMDGFADERPRHVVEIDSFLIDAEPVSTTAFCRFLNSVGDVSPEVLTDWFILDPNDDRQQHMVIECVEGEWRPLTHADRWPMILVSWYGANAYSLWANSKEWSSYADDTMAAECFLPTEAQWEYAARGNTSRRFPWGDEAPTHDKMRFAQHARSRVHQPGVLPLSNVNDEMGMSPFGLHHMAGNVWQWCRDWYDEEFYRKPASVDRNPLNRTPTQARSERGGSWVGPAELCRSSHRRGRPPHARGRCLGFRCVMPVSCLARRAFPT
jgi:formylglycine-generating enzyme